MRILVVGKNNIMEWPQSVNNALRSLSYDTELFLFKKKLSLTAFYVYLVKKPDADGSLKFSKKEFKILNLI